MTSFVVMALSLLVLPSAQTKTPAAAAPSFDCTTAVQASCAARCSARRLSGHARNAFA